MNPSEPAAPGPRSGPPHGSREHRDSRPSPVTLPRRYGRYVGALGVVIVVLITINAAMTKPNGARGVAPGHAIPPFAAPLATGNVSGAVNVATHANDGSAGKVPACSVRKSGVLNVCELYEHRPLVLAVFVDASSCNGVLSDMQALARQFPGVSFAGVALHGERSSLRKLIRQRGLTDVQVGIDSDGVLLDLYKVASCPQVTLALPGGVVQSPALLGAPSRQTLRERVTALVTAAKARGWKQP